MCVAVVGKTVAST